MIDPLPFADNSRDICQHRQLENRSNSNSVRRTCPSNQSTVSSTADCNCRLNLWRPPNQCRISETLWLPAIMRNASTGFTCNYPEIYLPNIRNALIIMSTKFLSRLTLGLRWLNEPIKAAVNIFTQSMQQQRVETHHGHCVCNLRSSHVLQYEKITAF